jgi:methylphosphotriester-DNA--protein-cysteine methyltransferase
LQAPTTAEQGLIIGNKNSKVYHLPGCAGYNRVSEKNQVKFNSAAEAEAAGYKLAGNCSANKTGAPVSEKSAAPQSQTPATPSADAKPAEPTSDTSATTSSEGKVIGNKNSHIYHLPACSGYKNVSEQNRVYFNSEEEAQKAGYRKAKNCK